MVRENQKAFGDAIRTYWNNKTHGLRRLRGEDWLKKYADELLAIIPGRGTLFDVGCGSCEIASYLAPHFERIYGIDFSDSMLEAARQRIDELGIRNIELIAGTMTEFPAVARKPKVILSYAVIQYIGAAEFKRHLDACRSVLEKGGTVCVGLIPDTERRHVYFRRMFPDRSNLRRRIDLVGLRITRYLQNDPVWDEIGNWYSHADIRGFAAEAGFEAEFHDSQYADYRFHALLHLRSGDVQ
jgi:ubiquinone/menaquinone biosynthesis C-methylase UbiE